MISMGLLVLSGIGFMCIHIESYLLIDIIKS